MFFLAAMSTHFDTSSRTFFVSTSGAPPAGSKPILAKLSFVSGSASTALSLAFKRSTSGCGVFAGANRPYQVERSKPGSADSEIVATSGNTCQRCALPTASSLTWLPRIAERRGAVEGELRAAPDQVGKRRRAAAVGDVAHVDVRHREEELGAEMVDAPVAEERS